MRPSTDWPIWPTTTRSSTAPRRSGPKILSQGGGRDRLGCAEAAAESRPGTRGGAENVGEFPPGIRVGRIADAIISSNDAMCVGLDERHIHRFNHRRLSLQDNLVSGKPAEIISSGLE